MKNISVALLAFAFLLATPSVGLATPSVGAASPDANCLRKPVSLTKKVNAAPRKARKKLPAVPSQGVESTLR